MQVENRRPLVLCFGGLDPSGGAGLQADIETIASCGGHALPIATCLTVQNSVAAIELSIVDEQLMRKQAEVLLNDMRIACCKIGVIPNVNIAITIAGIVAQIPEIPVVLDPVFAPSNGNQFSDSDTINAIREYLLPLVNVITPNLAELEKLSTVGNSNCLRAQNLCKQGPKYVLLTGTDESAPEVLNSLYTVDGLVKEYRWERLPNHYHGSGCTLSSAIACNLAHEMDIADAVYSGQQLTWQFLQAAEPLGTGQWIPNRMEIKFQE